MPYQYKIGEVIDPGKPPVFPKTEPYVPPALEPLPEYKAPELPDYPDFVTPKLPDYPVYKAPELPEMPKYTAPEWDEGKIKGLTQTFAAPGLRSLRQQMARATTQPSSNPNVRAMTLREALAGYGAGLESIMSGARQTAGSEYAREYGIKADEAKTNFQTELNKAVMQGNLTQDEARTNFQAALNKVVAEGQMSLEEVKMNFQTALNKAVEQGRMTEEEARINYQSMLNQALSKQQIGQEASKINYEIDQKRLHAEYQAAYADYMAKEARKPVYGGVSSSSPSYRSYTPSGTSDYGRELTTPTETVDLMGYISDGGYEPSISNWEEEPEKNDYWDIYQQTYLPEEDYSYISEEYGL